VYNRDFLIHDADNFTKAWYIMNMGASEADFPNLEINEVGRCTLTPPDP
jgi:hypothetical protein